MYAFIWMQSWFACCPTDVQLLCRWVRRRAAAHETDAETLAEIDAVPGVRLLQDLHTLKAINKVTLFSCSSRRSGVAGLSHPHALSTSCRAAKPRSWACQHLSVRQQRQHSAGVGAPLPMFLLFNVPSLQALHTCMMLPTVVQALPMFVMPHHHSCCLC